MTFTLGQIVFVIFNLAVAAYDFSSRRVPNWLILAGIVVQAFYIFLKPTGGWLTINWHDALAGLSLALIIFFPFWRFRAMGAGDVKFFAALGFIAGFPGLLTAVLVGSVLLGIHAVVMVFALGWQRSTAHWNPSTQHRTGLPYAAYVAIGALVNVVAWRNGHILA